MSPLAFLGFACGAGAILIVVAACVSGGRADDRLDEYAAEHARVGDDGPWLSEPLAEIFPFPAATSRTSHKEAPAPLATARGAIPEDTRNDSEF